LQFSAAFLDSVADYVDPGLPFISLSKGLELNTLRTMAQIIPQALRNPRQPFVALSGPSFALELMNKLPTGYNDIANYTCEFCFSKYVYYSVEANNFCHFFPF
jgi:glycerol-3-phosphate dehydrogenase (NAD+)